MKKLIFLIIALTFFALWFYIQQDDKQIIGGNLDTENNYPPQENKRYVFVPYWTIDNNLNEQNYDSLIYFGVTIDNNGLDTDDEGYSEINRFTELIDSSKEKYLTLRIIGEHTDGKILDNTAFQRNVGKELGELASRNGFDGVVIDYETSAFGFTSTEKKITDMYKVLKEEISKYNLKYGVTLFGDTYYRARPYNVNEIASLSDEVIIMAYDFHKARLNPGPNFPLSYKREYGYDIKSMIKDFRKDAAHEKIVVTLGYFGYNWEMNDNGISRGMAESLSLSQIKARYINNCPVNNCEINQNEDLESVVRYTDEEGYLHEVWFEDEESAERKIEFLKKEGINQIASWAYSFY